MRSSSTVSTYKHFIPLTAHPSSSEGLSSGLLHLRVTAADRYPANNNYHYTNAPNIQDHYTHQVVGVSASSSHKQTAPITSTDAISNIYAASSRYSLQKKRSSSSGTALPLGNAEITVPNTNIPSYYNSVSGSTAISGSTPNNISYSVSSYGRSHSTSVYSVNDNAGYALMQERATGKINSGASHLGSEADYPISIIKDRELQKASKSGGFGKNLARHWSIDVDATYTEVSPRRAPLTRQKALEVTPSVTQPAPLDPISRGYASKNVIGPPSLEITGTLFVGSIDNDYSTMTTPFVSTTQTYGSNYPPLPHQIFNERGGSKQRDLHSQEGMISVPEFMQRLLQAHQAVDDLLRSRGLIPEDELEYLRQCRLKMEQKVKTEERDVPLESMNCEIEDVSRVTHQRRTSNTSDSGLSMDADSEKNLRCSSELQGPNLRKSEVKDQLLIVKEAAIPKEFVGTDVKTKKHKNVCLQVRVKKSLHNQLDLDINIRPERDGTVDGNKKAPQASTGNDGEQVKAPLEAATPSRASVQTNNKNESQQTSEAMLQADTEVLLVHAETTVSGRAKVTAEQNMSAGQAPVHSSHEKKVVTPNKYKQDPNHKCQMKKRTKQSEHKSSQKLTEIPKSSFIEPTEKAGKPLSQLRHNAELQFGKNRPPFMVTPKCETANVRLSFADKLRTSEKAEIVLTLARFAEIKSDSIDHIVRKIPQKAKKQGSREVEEDALCALLNATLGKLPLFNRKLSAVYKNFASMQKPASGKQNSELIEVRKESERISEEQDLTMEPFKETATVKRTGKHQKVRVLTKKRHKEATKPQETVTSSKLVQTTTIHQAFPRDKQIQLCTVTLSKNLHKSSNSASQIGVTTTLPEAQGLKIAKQFLEKKMEVKQGGLLAVNSLSVHRKNHIELKKAQREQQQSYRVVTPKYYQKILRSTSGNENKPSTEQDSHTDANIRHAREHLRRIEFNKSEAKLEARASLVHRFSEQPGESPSHPNGTGREMSMERTSSISLTMEKTKTASGATADKRSKERLERKCPAATEKGCHSGEGVMSKVYDNTVDSKLISEYRRTQCIPKPLAKIPIWDVCEETKHASPTIRNAKPHKEESAVALVAPRFIRCRTPIPLAISGTASSSLSSSTSASSISLLRHVTFHPPPATNSPQKNVATTLEKGITITTNGSQQQQQSPRSWFGVMLKRIDRSSMLQKSKPRGAITQSAPKKPWVPKWRRIQRSEEEEEEEEEVDEVPSVEVTKDASAGGEEEQEEKQIATRFPSRRPSQVATEKDEKDMTEAEKAMLEAKRRQEEEEATKLQEYEEKRRVEREREEEELRKLKEKKERRKLEREEEERQFQEKLRQEEERRKQEEEERKAKQEAEKRKKEEEKKKRQQMLSSQFANTAPGQTGRNFVIPQKTDRADKFGNIVQAKQEMGMTKEQQEEAKRNYLASVKRTIDFENTAPAELREKIRQLHQRICKLEADKYDLEKRHERQEYDLRELNERQRQVARNRALKKGIDPADTNSRHPPKVSIVSKYDRQIDRRNFKERRAMFENKNAYPCFPNVPPPPTVYEKVILSEDKENEPEEDAEEEEAAEQAGQGAEDEETPEEVEDE